MVTMDMYAKYLNGKDRNLSEVRKMNSAIVMNATFAGDVGYKCVYILDPKEGWMWTDAKYSQHSKQSIAKDDVDYYLQFRPYEHHPVGTYVFIPDDTSPEIGFAKETPVNPFKDANFEDIFKAGKLWMIVDRNNANEFVRYMILQVNWNFKWITYYKGKKKLFNVYGITRTQNSYTSGVWSAEYSVELDQVTGCWLPDTNYVFGDDIDAFDLCDTRYFYHDLRLMLSTNKIYPKCYKVTKVNELAPKGILKCTVKQDEFDEKKDNVELMICNYYDDSGDIVMDEPIAEDPNPEKTSIIHWAEANDDGELVETNNPEDMKLRIGNTSYFMAEFSDDEASNIEWRFSYVNVTDADEELSDKRKAYYCGLLNITSYKDDVVDGNATSSIAVKTSKIPALKGKKFLLTVQDHSGEYKSSITVEVDK